MTCLVVPRTSATHLAALLGVSPRRIALWHRRGVITGHRTPADRRRVVFRLDDVRRAIDEHCLPVAPDIVAMIDEALAECP